MGYWCFPSVFVVLLFVLADCSMDFQCLKCLCETATKCVSIPCDSVKCAKIEPNNHECSCGPFGLTPSFWMSANKPTLDDKGVTEAEKFKKCVETFPCSIWAVQYYMEKFAEDCDNDKLVSCDDYVLIQTYGPKNCHNSSLSEDRLERYKTCMSRKEIIRPGISVRTTTKTTTTVKSTTNGEGEDNKNSTYSVKEEKSTSIKPIEESIGTMQELEWNDDF